MIASEVIKVGQARFNSSVENMVESIISRIVNYLSQDPYKEEVVIWNDSDIEASPAQLQAISTRLASLGYVIVVKKSSWWTNSRDSLHISGWNKEAPKQEQPYR